MLNNYYQFAIELTNVLQILFAAATIKKLTHNHDPKPLSILIFVTNKHVNERTIEISLSLFKRLKISKNKSLEFCDMRIHKLNFSCDVAIVRTRLNKNLYFMELLSSFFYKNWKL